MPLKCYTRQRKDGSNYVSCDNTKDLKTSEKKTSEKKTSEKKNVSNNKMPHKSGLLIADFSPHLKNVHKTWQEAQKKYGALIRPYLSTTLADSVFGHKATKTGSGKQRQNMMAIRQVAQVKKFATKKNDAQLNQHLADYDKAYEKYRKGRASFSTSATDLTTAQKGPSPIIMSRKPASSTMTITAGDEKLDKEIAELHKISDILEKKKKDKPAKTLYTLARKGPSTIKMKSKPPSSTMKISKPVKKKVVVKLDPSKIHAITKLGKPLPKGKVKVYGVKKTTTARPAPIQKVTTKRPRKSKPVRDAKTIPHKIAREELKGATKKNIVKPFLARNIRRGAGAVFV
jgi:hypothetical protein